MISYAREENKKWISLFFRVKTFQTFSRLALEQKATFVEHIGVAFAQEFYWVTSVSTVMLCAPSWDGKKLSFMIIIGLGAHDMSESEIGIGWKIVTK